MSTFGKKQYIAFTIEDESRNYVFAAPVENIDALVPLTGKTPYSIPPRACSRVLCVMNPYGKLVTIINLLSLFGCSFVPKDANTNVIIVLNFQGKAVGVPAQNAQLVSAYPHELTNHEATGPRVFAHGEVQYYVLDIPRLYRYLEQ